ncbi:SRPBCC family protein [Sphingomonas sp. BK235]|uniref:SRPBCC family protein n=1 Tax=Sphingomonas sp. BK235 TaxID=2512131 RepID=UPI001050592D|nr:SRPBCC family protein [Sphingomonas sp. BK235]TCP37441.1 putative membrane protein [Sphingomonas sp. BK235]
MADQLLHQQSDDAPLAASKQRDAVERAKASIPAASGTQITARAVTINRPVAEVFAYFRDFANFPSFMENVERIDVLDRQRSHWVVKAPAGGTVEWDARLTAEEENTLLAWTSEDGAEVPNSGRVEFHDAGARGTVLVATILYDPPGGVIGKVIAKMFQREPAIQARRDLRRLKQLLETGEIATPAMNREQYEEMGL